MADYYLSADGDDTNGGSFLSPWKTINRLNDAFDNNEIHLSDRVFLRRGDTFYGAIRPRYYAFETSGSDWVPIRDYGDDDALPIVAGWKLLNIASGWVQHDADTWKINISAAQWGVTHTGYDSAQGVGNVGILRVDGVIYADNKYTLAELANQWDYYTDGIRNVEGAATTLYVRSSAKPTTLAADIQCTIDCDGLDFPASAIQVTGLDFWGWGGHGAQFRGESRRNRLLRCSFRDIGGAFFRPSTDLSGRYGNGIQAWVSARDIHCEQNVIHDVYDTAWTIQGGTPNVDTHFEDITWRRNLTYRCSQAEEYWYEGNGDGFINCRSEYNTNLFPGYGFGADTRPDPETRVAQLTYHWGWNGGAPGTTVPIETPTLSRNIYYGPRGAFSYHASTNPAGLVSDNNVLLLRPDTLMQYQTTEEVVDWAAWAAAAGREQHSQVTLLDDFSGGVVTNSDVTAAIGSLDDLVRMGQLAGNKVLPIHAPWRDYTA